jgi:glycosyltransferase involved in cell wall biosynthesis
MYVTRALRRRGHSVVVLPWSVVVPNEQYRFKMVPFHSSVAIANHQSGTSSDVLRFTDEDRDLLSSNCWTVFNPYGRWPVRVDRATLDQIMVTTQADLFIAFQDPFIFQEGPSRCPGIVWMPTHFQPLEHKVLLSLDSFDGVVAMSRYGEKILRDAMDRKAIGDQHGREFWYVPHACETDVFCPDPADPDERAKTRRRYGWPDDAHVTLMVAANTEKSNRKAWDVQIQAWSLYARRSRRPVHLHIHSTADGALDLPRILEVFGELPDRFRDYADTLDPHARTKLRGIDASLGVRGPRVTISPPALYSRLTAEELAAMYRSADMLLSASCSEGFGVPILEAQMCGTPVVTSMTTAMPELTLHGISVPVCHWIMRDDFDTGWFVSSPADLAKALARVADFGPAEKDRFRESTLATLRKRYSAESVVAGWDKVVQDVERRNGNLNPLNQARKLQIDAGKVAIRNADKVVQIQSEIASLRSAIQNQSQRLKLLFAERSVLSEMT